MKPYFERDGITIYHGDSREIVPQLSEPIGTVLTDPPYGVGLGDKKRAEKMAKHGNDGYTAIDDTPDYVRSVVLPVIATCRSVADRVVLTPGLRCLFLYDDPDALWCIHYPNGAGVGRWKAFTCWQPVLCYGKAPTIVGCYPDTFVTTEQAEVNGHPCPKPIALWRTILRRVSAPTDTILDPFMGSGTTLRAALDLGRKAIGIELEERYCEIAARRLSQMVLPLAGD